MAKPQILEEVGKVSELKTNDKTVVGGINEVLEKEKSNAEQINICLKFIGDILDLDDAYEEGIYGITPQTTHNPFPSDYGKCIVFKKPDINAIHQAVFKTSGNANASMATRNSYFVEGGKIWSDWHIPVSIAQLNNALAINNLTQV